MSIQHELKFLEVILSTGQLRKLACVQITTDMNITQKYCGSVLPATLHFDATFVNLKFVSDSSVSSSGFKITYSIATRKGYHLSIYYVQSAEKILLKLLF